MEGTLQLRDALEAGAAVLEVFVEDSDEGTQAEQLCIDHGLRWHRVDRAVARTLSQTITGAGVVAAVRSPHISLNDMPKNADLIAVLAEVRDPGNAGTLMRSAAAAGADAVIFSTRSVDPLSAKTVRSAAGALFRLSLVKDVDLQEAVATLRARGFVIVATDAHAEVSPEACDMTRPTALMLGNEAQGLPAEAEPLMDETVGIPMPGQMESLNVAVAGSILLFEAVRQRRNRETEARSHGGSH